MDATGYAWKGTAKRVKLNPKEAEPDLTGPWDVCVAQGPSNEVKTIDSATLVASSGTDFSIVKTNTLQTRDDATNMLINQFDGTTVAVVNDDGSFSVGSLNVSDYKLPLADGAANQYVKTDGAGQLSFSDGGSGGFVRNHYTMKASRASYTGGTLETIDVSGTGSKIISSDDFPQDSLIRIRAHGTFNVASATAGSFVVSVNGGTDYSAAVSQEALANDGFFYLDFTFYNNDGVNMAANGQMLCSNGATTTVTNRKWNPQTPTTQAIPAFPWTLEVEYIPGQVGDGCTTKAYNIDIIAPTAPPIGVATTNDHTALTNLTLGDAGHTQFAQLTGRSGGQTLEGGTGSGDSLTLESNSFDPATGGVNVSSTLKLGTNKATTSYVPVDGIDLCNKTYVDGKTGAQVSGTPQDSQIAVWTGATDIEGTSGLTYDGTALGVTGAATISGDATIKNSLSLVGALNDIDVSGITSTGTVDSPPDMTSDTAPVGYVASTSSFTVPYNPYLAFDSDTATFYYSANPRYDSTTGEYTGAVSITMNTGTVSGEWLKIALPEKRMIKSLTMRGRSGTEALNRMCNSFVVGVSDDDSTWTNVYEATGVQWADGVSQTFTFNGSGSYFVIVARSVGNTGQTNRTLWTTSNVRYALYDGYTLGQDLTITGDILAGGADDTSTMKATLGVFSTSSTEGSILINGVSEANNSSQEGMMLRMGDQISGGRQIWIQDSEWPVDASRTAFRIGAADAGGGTYKTWIGAVSTDGSAAKPLYCGGDWLPFGTRDLGGVGDEWSNLYLSGNITVGGTVDGRDIAADGAKLDGAAQVSGTPADSQIAVWTGATDIEGTSGLTYDGTALGVTGDAKLTTSGFTDYTTSWDLGANSTYVSGLLTRSNTTGTSHSVSTNTFTTGTTTQDIELFRQLQAADGPNLHFGIANATSGSGSLNSPWLSYTYNTSGSLPWPVSASSGSGYGTLAGVSDTYFKAIDVIADHWWSIRMTNNCTTIQWFSYGDSLDNAPELLRQMDNLPSGQEYKFWIGDGATTLSSFTAQILERPTATPTVLSSSSDGLGGLDIGGDLKVSDSASVGGEVKAVSSSLMNPAPLATNRFSIVKDLDILGKNSEITVSGPVNGLVNVSASSTTNQRFIYFNNRFAFSTGTGKEQRVFVKIKSTGALFAVGLTAAAATNSSLTAPYIYITWTSATSSHTVYKSGITGSTVQLNNSQNLTAGDWVEIRLSSNATAFSYYYHGQTLTTTPTLKYNETGITNTDSVKWLFGDTNNVLSTFDVDLYIGEADFQYNNAFAEGYCSTTETTTISGTGAVAVDFNGNFISKYTNGMHISDEGVFTYTGNRPRLFHMGASFTVRKVAGGGADDIEVSVYQGTDGGAYTLITGSGVIRTVTSTTDKGSTALHTFANMSYGDRVRLYVSNSGSNNVEFQRCNFFCMAMPAVSGMAF